MVIASIPSPSSGSFHLGPLQLRAYGLMIALGVFAAIEIARHRWKQRGGDPDAITTIALWAVPAGLVGARIYHVITDNELYRGHWLDAFKIWNGGLGIWGGVAVGVLVGAIVARRKGYDIPTLLDCVAPALPVAQAIGRLGNYFNQELFGGPTSLPWGLEIAPAHRPAGYEHTATFHPTFLYEAVWNLALAALIIWVIPRVLPRLKTGRLFVVYIAGYTLGRLLVELMPRRPRQSDPRSAGQRLGQPHRPAGRRRLPHLGLPAEPGCCPAERRDAGGWRVDRRRIRGSLSHAPPVSR